MLWAGRKTENFRGQQTGLDYKAHNEKKEPTLSFINLLLTEWISAEVWESTSNRDNWPRLGKKPTP